LMSFWKKKLLTFSSILTEITPPCTDAHTGAIMPWPVGRYGWCIVKRNPKTSNTSPRLLWEQLTWTPLAKTSAPVGIKLWSVSEYSGRLHCS